MNIPENKHLGTLCRRGHDWNNTGKSLRNNAGNCYKCLKEYCQKHKDKIKEYQKEYHQKHREKGKKQRKEYYKTHKEKMRIQHSIYAKTHKEKMSEYRKKSYNLHKEERKIQSKEYSQRPEVKKRKEIRFKTNPKYKLRKNISNLIRISLKRNKGGYHWENLVGYTLQDLKKHLEKQFIDGMSWEKFLKGEIHIDHIIPISVFNFTKPEHLDFKRCFALSNLQPLWAIENLQKGTKLTKDFQPSLTL